MALVRLPIAGPLETRDGTLTQDEVRTNVYIEPLDNQTAVVKRPGTRLCAYVAPGSCGRGATFWNGRIRAIFGADVYSQNDCHVGATISGGGNALGAGPASLSGSGTVTPPGGGCAEANWSAVGDGDIVSFLGFNATTNEAWVQKQEEFDLFQARITRLNGTTGAVAGTIVLGDSDLWGTFQQSFNHDPSGPWMWTARVNRLAKYNATTNALVFEVTLAGFYNLFVTPNAREVLLPHTTAILKRLNKTDGTVSQTYSSLPGNVLSAIDVTGGLVWFCVQTGGTNRQNIYTLDLGSGTVTLRYTHTANIIQLEWDEPRGHVWACTEDSKALRLDLSYSLQQTITLPFRPTTEISISRGMVHDAQRDVLWIADYSNKRFRGIKCSDGSTFRNYDSLMTHRPREIRVDQDGCYVYVITEPSGGGYQTVVGMSVPLS